MSLRSFALGWAEDVITASSHVRLVCVAKVWGNRHWRLPQTLATLVLTKMTCKTYFFWLRQLRRVRWTEWLKTMISPTYTAMHSTGSQVHRRACVAPTPSVLPLFYVTHGKKRKMASVLNIAIWSRNLTWTWH